jgi:thiol:disulfide interchange protein
MQKIQVLFGLFILILIVMFMNPRIINDVNKSVLGRIMMIGLVIYFTCHNTTLGLLVALCLIIAINMFVMEGIDETLASEEEEEKSVTMPMEEEDGIDTQTVHESIQPVESNTIPVSKDTFSSVDVAPLNPEDRKEGFAVIYP